MASKSWNRWNSNEIWCSDCHWETQTLEEAKWQGEKPKRANRKIHRIPFHKFRIAIQSVAWQHGIDVVEVPAAKTSQKCPKCGYISKKNWVFFKGKRKLFMCVKCGYEANVDRTASRNIATLALERGLVSLPLSTPVFQSWRGCQPPCPARWGGQMASLCLQEQALVFRREKLTSTFSIFAFLSFAWERHPSLIH